MDAVTVIDALIFVLSGTTFAALIKQLLIALIALVNAVLALLAGLAVWRSLLLTGAKILITAILLIPVIGIAVYILWCQKKVRQAI